MLLEEWQLLKEPLLYVSGYLKQHQRYYYQCLTDIRSKGDWEQWVAFFLEAVTFSAEEAQQGIIRIATLFADDRKKILSMSSTSVHTIRLFEFLPTMPKLTVERAVELLEVTYPTANNAVKMVYLLRRQAGRVTGATFTAGTLSFFATDPHTD